jgi:hypothetical protein
MATAEVVTASPDPRRTHSHRCPCRSCGERRSTTGTSTHLALSTRRDLGEAIVIGHAKALADAGHDVYVVIDDQGGQTLASNEGLTILTVEDLLIAAVRLGLLPPERLRKTYEDLIPFGSGLPTWDASTMKQKYNEWRRSQT